MDKPALIKKIKALDLLTNAEKSDLIDLLNNTKKYGLVWEDKPEDVERDLLTMLPVLQEVPERRILAKDLIQIPFQTEKSKPGDPTLFSQPGTEISADTLALPGNDDVIADSKGFAPNHILIEGDNLHVLTALSFTHEGKIDVMYFDPPYNTGSKDFKYNDSYVDKEDSYRHSKWLSFMHKRLLLAHQLLSETGVIFISIDDNEQAQLKLLCDIVFGEENFISNIIWQKRISPDSRRILGPAHDNIYTYGKTKAGYENLNLVSLSEEQEQAFKNPDNDPKGPWVSSDFTAQGFRPNQMYEITTPKGNRYLPPEGRCWKNIEPVYRQQLKDGKMWFGMDGTSMPRRKTYLAERKGAVPWTWWDHKSSGNNQEAKKEIIDILGKATAFDTPKPLRLLKKIITISSNTKSIILDIFAGSGTTLHATMAINAEDSGNRQCILVTNNENNICEEVTYERNKRVIAGYTNAKGVQISGLTNNNFRFYKTGFVPSAKTEVNRRHLTNFSVELLQIKEDCYNDVTMANGLDPSKCCICTNETGKYLVAVFHSRKQSEVIEKLCDFIRNISDLSEKVRLYAFSPETETLAEDFYSVADKINAVPLPEAIYNAYRATFKTLKLGKKIFSPQSPVTAAEQGAESENSGQSDLFEKEEE